MYLNRHRDSACYHEQGKGELSQPTLSGLPSAFTVDTGYTQMGVPRQQNQSAIGRMYFVSPIQGEPYYLRLLLTAVRGLTYFTDLRTFNSVEYTTFQVAAAAHGLLSHDGDWDSCFRETVISATDAQLRSFFASDSINQTFSTHSTRYFVAMILVATTFAV